MKKIIRIISLLLMLMIGMSAMSCSCNTPTEPPTSSLEEAAFDVVKDANGQTVYLVENGTSKYKIVVPDESNIYENLASSDLQLFIQQSTGVILPILKASEIDLSQGKYIFIGRAAGKESVVTTAEYGANGAYLDVENENVYLTGAKGYGITNSVYQFLKYQIGWKIYAFDEITFEPTEKLALLDFQDFKYKPFYDYVTWRSQYAFGYDARYDNARMGQLQASHKGGGTLEGQLYSSYLSNLHTLITTSTANTLMEEARGEEIDALVEEKLAQIEATDEEKEAMRAKVRADVIDENGFAWFINGHLCLSKPEVRAHVTEVVKDLLINEPNAEYMQLGNRDDMGACSCPWCVEKLKTCYTHGGVSIDFMNEISKNLEDEKFFEKHPEVNKDVKLTFLNYLSFEQPPVDDNGNVYVTARDNVGVYWCPISACYSHGLDDPECDVNAKDYKNLVGWSKVTKHLGVYVYGCDYRNYYTFFNNWGHFQNWAQNYKKYNIEYISYHAPTEMDHAPFDRLRHYIFNEYLEDPYTRDFDTVAKDFINRYYKVAADEIWAYYEELRQLTTIVNYKTGYSCSKCFDDKNAGAHYTDEKWWSWETIDKLLDYVYSAYEKIDNSNLSVAEKETLKFRILGEEVALRYWRYTYHKGYFTTNDLEAEKLYLQETSKILDNRQDIE